ncbi:MAG: QueT transporter family protein, partial [Oscillospiraceae bacterium]
MKKISTRSLARCAMIAALYFVLSALLLPLSSFGTLQVRVAEAFTLLPVVTPLGIPGVTLGCALTNAWGVASGAD